MGKISQLLAKAEELAVKELEKRLTQQQQQQQQQGTSGGGHHQVPLVLHVAAPQPFATPPPSPPPYAAAGGPQLAGAGYRPSTPPPPQLPQQQYLAPTTYSPDPAGPGRKKALLIAVSYPGTRSALPGPSNDAACLQYLLTHRLGFPPRCILVLRDDDLSRGSEFVPTRDTIIRACNWLASDLRAGDSLFLGYSGHGSQLRDPTGEEEDGYDETILPTDHERAGQIRDTELARVLVHGLPAGVILHALFDSCHSGTMLDLPYETRWGRGGLPAWHRTSMRGTAGGTVVQLGACDDHQTAADTSRLSATAYTGAATFCFIQSIERWGPRQTYLDLLGHMTETLRSLGAGRMSKQRPVLCCDRPLDIRRVQLLI